MAGPWEDYGGAAEQSGPWDDFKQPSTPAAEAAPSVQPGDVEGRKRQLAADTEAAPVRDISNNPIVSIIQEGAGGLAQAVKGASGALKASPTTIAEAQDVAFGGIKDIALGGVRTAASPFAPVDAAAARAGESVQDKLLASGANPVIAAGAATLADMGINIGGSLGIAGLARNARRAISRSVPALEKISPTIARKAETVSSPEFLKSNRAKAAEATTRGEAAISTAEARGTQASADAVAQRATVRGKTAAAKKQLEYKSDFVKSSLDKDRGLYEQFGESAKRSIPTKQDLKAIAGDELAETTGIRFKGAYEATRKVRKEAGDKLYDDALGPRAAGQKSAVDTIDEVQDSAVSLLEQSRAARGTPNEAEALKRYTDFLSTGGVSEKVSLRDLHGDLIKTRREHRAATRLQEDNIARELGLKQDEIVAQMEKLSPGVTEKLAAADANYATTFAPYFSKGSATRAIADADPAAIAKNAILPRSLKGKKEVEAITRTLELIGDNEPLRRQMAGAHLNGLLDDASRGADFRDTFVKGWERYTNPSGNNNKVLRTAYGKDYESINSIVNQFRSSKPKDIDAVVKGLVKSAEKGSGETIKRLTAASTAAEKGAAARVKDITGKAAFEKKAADVEVKVLRKKLDNDLRSLVGEEGSKIATRFQSIGSGIVASGAIRGNPHTVTVGGILAVSGGALNKLLGTVRGRSVWKAIMRSAPGSTQAAANARIAEKLLSAPGSSGESE